MTRQDSGADRGASPAAPGTSFDLLTEPWLTVYSQDGSARQVGIREALNDAHTVWLAVAGPNEVVMLRLLAAVYGAAAGPQTEQEWDAAWRSPTLDRARIDAYLDRWRDRFDLYHPQNPWLQSSAIKQTPRGPGVLSLSSLAPSAGPFFDHRMARGEEGHPPWEADAAARELLVRLAIDTAGVKPAVPGDPSARGGKIMGSQKGPLWLTTHLHVDTGGPLKDLLLLAWPPYQRPAADTPAWERPSPAAPYVKRAPEGRLDWWTWPTRRVRLKPNPAGQVEKLAWHEGDRLDGPASTVATLDPMAAWTRVRGGRAGLRRFRSQDYQGWPVPWSLTRLFTGSGESGVVDHVVAAAARGVLGDDTVLRGVDMQVDQGDQYGSVLSSVQVHSRVLGVARQVGDPAWQRWIAGWGLRVVRLEDRLATALAAALGRQRDAVAPHLCLSQATEVWEELVLARTDGERGMAVQEFREVVTALVLSRTGDYIARVVGRNRPRAYAHAVSAVDLVLRDVGNWDLDLSEEEESQPSAAKRTGRPAKVYEAFGLQLTLAQLAERPECLVTYNTLVARVRGGMDPETAATTASRTRKSSSS